jgi:hypothetical protein
MLVAAGQSKNIVSTGSLFNIPATPLYECWHCFCLFCSQEWEQLYFVPLTFLTSRHLWEQIRGYSSTARNDVAGCMSTRAQTCSLSTHPDKLLLSILKIWNLYINFVRNFVTADLGASPSNSSLCKHCGELLSLSLSAPCWTFVPSSRLQLCWLFIKPSSAACDAWPCRLCNTEFLPFIHLIYLVTRRG